MTPPGPKSHAEQLMGLDLPNGWTVVKELERDAIATGARFSHGYIVEQANGRQGFLKALDYSRAMKAPDRADALKQLTSAYVFERDLFVRCQSKGMNRIVKAIDSNKVMVDPDHILGEVEYLIFEKADHDLRHVIAQWDSLDLAWVLRSLHHIAVGLQQLHTEDIAHQDLKPSNVLVFGNTSSKLTDLGRAFSRGNPQTHDDYPIAGDPSYAPPELLYEHVVADWTTRRLGCDLYLLGSMISFFFAGLGATGLLLSRVPRELHWDKWKGTYLDAIPYLDTAFAEVTRMLSPTVPELVRSDLIGAYEQLCACDFRRRGHPNNLPGGRGQFSIRRYVSLFNLLATRAEVRFRQSSK